jgi:putative mRNA 3-end processing factor
MNAPMADLVTLTPEGLYCPRGDFHIDPWRAVDRALITHAHGDHARRGSREYHTASSGVGLLGRRLGPEAEIAGHPFGRPLEIGGVRVSFHPAGHVLGSAQVRIEADGEVWVVSGDYKRDGDPSCEPFELVPCDVFISEATFGLPIYRWDAIDLVVEDLLRWWDANAAAGRASVLFCYALGKAQRVLSLLAGRTGREVWVHGAIEALLDAYRAEGIRLVATRPVGSRRRGESFAGELIHSAAIRLGLPLASPLRRVPHGLRFGLDASARSPAPARLRPRLRHLGPRRLAGPVAHHPRDRGTARARHPRLQRHACALSARAGARGAAVADPVRGRG